MRSPVWGPVSFRARLALVIGSGLVFVLGFVGLHAALGAAPLALSALPLVVGGLMFGARGGALGWVLVVALNIAVHLALGLPVAIAVGENPVRALVGLLISVTVGRMRDLSLAFEAESARRAAELARRLEESERREAAELRLRLTLSAIPDLVLRLAAGGAIVDVHAGHRSGLSVSAESLRGKQAAEVMPAAFVEHVLPALPSVIDTRTPRVAEYQVFRDGEVLDYEARLFASGPGEALALVRDVSDRRRLSDVLNQREREQAQARARERAAAAERHAALGTLAAGVAHEINNPLATVVANLGHLGRELQTEAGPLDAEQRETLRQAARDAAEGAERVRVIVRDLTTFVHADGYASDLVDLRAELDLAIDRTAAEVEARARLVRTYGEVARVRAPPGRLTDVFANLLSNAAHATPPGAPADHEVRAVVRMDGSDAVVAEIHDSGSGIPPDLLEHLFEPFFTTKKVGRGSGLGLYVCRNLVSALGGSIVVESAVGRGSVFRVRLPASTEDRAFTFERARGSDRGADRRGRVLVVDDDPTVGTAVTRSLARDDVVVVSGAQAALDRIAAGERFDVILCDLLLPQMNGMDLYASLSRTEKGQRDRMVFFTEGEASPVVRSFLSEVANHTLGKPLDTGQLAAVVDSRVRGA